MDNKVKNNLEGLGLGELKEILKSLKLYKDLSSKLGNRGKKLFSSKVSKKSIYKVEYFEAMSKDEALKEAMTVYKKVFNESVKSEDIILKPKKSLDGGIRVYKDDNMSDLSFKRVENILI